MNAMPKLVRRDRALHAADGPRVTPRRVIRLHDQPIRARRPRARPREPRRAACLPRRPASSPPEAPATSRPQPSARCRDRGRSSGGHRRVLPLPHAITVPSCPERVASPGLVWTSGRARRSLRMARATALSTARLRSERTRPSPVAPTVPARSAQISRRARSLRLVSAWRQPVVARTRSQDKTITARAATWLSCCAPRPSPSRPRQFCIRPAMASSPVGPRSTTTVVPGGKLAREHLAASGSSRCRWIARFSGPRAVLRIPARPSRGSPSRGR